jgi:hypothetical protein
MIYDADAAASEHASTDSTGCSRDVHEMLERLSQLSQYNAWDDRKQSHIADVRVCARFLLCHSLLLLQLSDQPFNSAAKAPEEVAFICKQ